MCILRFSSSYPFSVPMRQAFPSSPVFDAHISRVDVLIFNHGPLVFSARSMRQDVECENVAVRLCLDARDPITCNHNQHTHKKHQKPK